jgi:WD40 repeat protein
MTNPYGRPMLTAVRLSIVATGVVLIAAACVQTPLASTPTPSSAEPSFVVTPAATAPPSALRLTRPAPYHGDPPLLLRVMPEAGTIASPSGRWRYDGIRGTLDQIAAIDEPLEHPAPAGTLVALERQTRTPGGYAVSSELAIRDGAGPERIVYRAPELFYWSGWSPDGRYIGFWEVDFFSGSVDLDGRPLVVIEAATGKRVDLGRTLLHGSTAWTVPHTLAFVTGLGRGVWEDKTLEVWSPENGIRVVTPRGISGFAPAWSANGISLYFASGPAGEYEPLSVLAGRGVGDRGITVYDLATGTLRSLAHEPGYVEEGARPSRDGTKLVVLRRQIVVATDTRSLTAPPLEVWLTDPSGSHGVALVRIPNSFGYYGWDPGPGEWDWSE